MDIPSFYGVVCTKALFSSDPGCEMEIQRIEGIHDDTTTLNDEMDGDGTRSGFRTNGSMMQPDFEDEFPVDLVTMSDIKEGPEVFKRVRFLSRWEFRLESRGPLRYKTGQYNWWKASCPETLAMRKALRVAFNENWAEHVFPTGTPRRWQESLFINFFFVGSTLQQSRPVLVIFSMSKKVRRETQKHFTGIDWVRANPSLVLLTSCSTMFHSRISLEHAMRYRAHIDNS
ncbi:hypothetical protein IG631_11530 [Alternaria alternata]|nr:hypothetical protein IG631_11530 [Alternaria alternata]